MTAYDDPFVGELLASDIPERREITPDWANVLHRAGLREQWHLKLSRRRLLIALAAILVAVLVSALAVSAENDWWFLRGTKATPTGGVVVVATGTWEGHGWTLTAYRTNFNPGEEVCLALTPEESPGPRRRQFFCGMIPVPSEPFSFGGAGMGSDFPNYVLAPVPGEATNARIELTDGETIEAKTIPAPAELGLPIRFLATPLPECPSLENIAALDDQNKVVAQSGVLHQAGTCPGEHPWLPPPGVRNR
ncbi:MAG: hypothetical protein WBQ14_01860 [Gaiellaceae bacterium]